MEHDLKQLEELLRGTLSLLKDQQPGLALWNDALAERIKVLRAALSESYFCSKHTAVVAYNARRRYNGLSEITSSIEMTPADLQESLYVVKAVASYLRVKILP